MESHTQKIAPFLWFKSEAETAAAYYTELFGGKIISKTPYGKEGPGPDDAVMVVNFELFGQEFVALNGNAQDPFTNAISFYVKCETQPEIDQYWDAIIAGGGQELACGWIKDKFGVAWQITPTLLPKLLQDPDPEKAARVMKAMGAMVKIDLATIEAAYKGL